MATWTQETPGSMPDGLDDTEGFAWSFGGSTVREAEVLAPSDMVALLDTQFEPLYRFPTGRFDLGRLIGFFGYDQLYKQGVLGQPVLGPGTSDPMVSAYQHRHSWKWNVAFCDAHVESLAPLALWDLSKSSVARRWNRDHLPHVEPGWSP
jgi:prepilin-type processing-associated H-X9-DG protein